MISILQDEVKVPLKDTADGLDEAVAFMRPMDVVDRARWIDKSAEMGMLERGVTLARLQVVRIEGLEVQGLDGTLVPFDVKNDTHFAALPFESVTKMYYAVLIPSSLTEEQEKN